MSPDELKVLDSLFSDLKSKDNKIRYRAFKELQRITEQKVSWVYDRWFELVDKLDSENSYQRTIGFTLLTNLCKSDNENRLSSILDRLFICFEDEKFIHVRLCIQNAWKIALQSDYTRKKVIGVLENTYYENKHLSTHANLIKQDVIFSLHQINMNNSVEGLREKIMELIESETDQKLVKQLMKVIV